MLGSSSGMAAQNHNDILFLISWLYFDKLIWPYRFKCCLYANNSKVFISASDHSIELQTFVCNCSFEFSKVLSNMDLKINTAQRDLSFHS